MTRKSDVNQTEKISIFVAGVQKGGTTSLFAHLREHPDLFAPDRKELHFFDDETQNWSAPEYQRLQSHFPENGGSGLRFEATPIYLFWPPSLERIRNYNPSAKLILLFRDPIERAWSHWCMGYSRHSKILPFSDAIRSGRDRLDINNRLSAPWRSYSYIERGFYAEQAARALSLFPRESILWLRSQDLWDRHQDVLASISAFLGISPFPDTGPRREFCRPNISYPSELTHRDIEFLAGLFHNDVLRFATLTGLDVNDWLTMRGCQAS